MLIVRNMHITFQYFWNKIKAFQDPWTTKAAIYEIYSVVLEE